MGPHADDSLASLRFSAEEAARRAGTVLAERFSRTRTIETKGSSLDLVTDADRASEQVLLAFLRERHPGHAVLAEESGASGAAGGHRWIVDPLDGTTNYAHGLPHFSVSVAVEGPDGAVLAGAVYDPTREELFSAARGQGATLDGAPLRTSGADLLDRALLVSGFPYDLRERPQFPIALFTHFLTRSRGVRRFGSAALDLAYVASGRFDGYFETSLKPWDSAAGALLVTEAGGAVTHFDGAAFTPMRHDVVAAGRALHPELLAEVQAFLASSGLRVP